MIIEAAEDVMICGTKVLQYIPVEVEVPQSEINTDMKRITGDTFITPVSYYNPSLLNKQYFLYWNDISRYVFQENGEWEYREDGGFNILIPGFNAQGQTFILTVDNN